MTPSRFPLSTGPTADRQNWFQVSFGHDYLRIYPHRDQAEAELHADFVWKKLALHDGQTVLDLGCGYGRHSLALGRYPLKIVGIDLSRILLSRAVEASQLNAHNALYVNGDMRSLPFRQRFDAVLNFFTSFGYFERDEENFSVLLGVADVLKSGGLFWFDYLNITQVRAHLVAADHKQQGNLHIEQQRRFDEISGRLEKRITVREGGEERHYIESVRAYEKDQILDLLARAGFSCVELLGDYRGNPFTADSPRLIVIGQKNQ